MLTDALIDKVLHRAMRQPVRRPSVDRLAFRSPLDIDLSAAAAGTVGGSVGLTFFYWLLKNPEKIAEFYPNLRTAWQEGQFRAEWAKG